MRSNAIVVAPGCALFALVVCPAFGAVTVESREAWLHLHVPENVEEELLHGLPGTVELVNDLTSDPGSNRGSSSAWLRSTANAGGFDFLSGVYAQTHADDLDDAIVEATTANVSEELIFSVDVETPFSMAMTFLGSDYPFNGFWSFALTALDGGHITLDSHIGDGALIDIGTLIGLQKADLATLTGTISPGRYEAQVFNQAITSSDAVGPEGQVVSVLFRIPAPGAAGLLGLGALATVRRRRG